ncbi:hypothetical protein [Myxococcus sp. AB036A]|uniref:hypothetical protein n=1 Tax=Myxococcus sp. AB036A TaxID=2562793 RepID=UPI001147A094|nr:hypothetical protein [Myxococcus sp. AB036A]
MLAPLEQFARRKEPRWQPIFVARSARSVPPGEQALAPTKELPRTQTRRWSALVAGALLVAALAF